MLLSSLLRLTTSSPPGRSLSDVTVTPQPVTTESPPTIAPRPSNAKAESNQRCATWYEVQNGDYCQAISIRQGIALRDFFFLNPSIDQPECHNLWLKTSYCVKAVGDINTYTSYPYSTSPVYTLSSSLYSTTTVPAVDTVQPSATPIVQLPLAKGSHSTADGCLEFIDYQVVSDQRDQSLQSDKPLFSKSVNSCDFVCAAFDVTFEQLLSWNPTLTKGDSCALQPGYSYCAMHQDRIGIFINIYYYHKLLANLAFFQYIDEPVYRTCSNVTTPYPGTIDSCTCFITVDGYDSGSEYSCVPIYHALYLLTHYIVYTCSDLATDVHLKISDLLAWNSWLGTESTCDQKMYGGLASYDERPVCIWVGSLEINPSSKAPSSTATRTTASVITATPTSIDPGVPIQTGIVNGCQKYYTAVKGDGCWAIANDNKIQLDDFYAWNPAGKLRSFSKTAFSFANSNI